MPVTLKLDERSRNTTVEGKCSTTTVKGVSCVIAGDAGLLEGVMESFFKPRVGWSKQEGGARSQERERAIDRRWRTVGEVCKVGRPQAKWVAWDSR